MTRKVYEVNPLICPQCGRQMKVIAFFTNYALVDCIVKRLKLTFETERPPPHSIQQELLMAAEERSEWF